MENAASIKELALFKIEDLTCGIDIIQIQEINKHFDIAEVCGAPEFVRGVMSLRGQIVTVIDLRLKFGFEQIEIHPEMRIVVVRFRGEQVGLLVDFIDDIIEVDSTHLDESPTNIRNMNPIYFNGVYKLPNRLVSILNTEEILTTQE